MNNIQNERILRLRTVMERTGLSRSSIYAFVAKGTFPQPLRIGQRAVGWAKSGIDAWIEERPSARNPKRIVE